MLPTLLQALFSSETRLYSLAWHDEAGPEMAVEAWWGKEELSGGFEYIIDLLSTDARIPESKLLGRVVTLSTTLSDGSKFKRSGGVRSVIKLGSDGGFCRYRLTVVPWLWLTTRNRHNRVFQEKSVIEIIDAVFSEFSQVATWRWSDEVAQFMADTRKRSYCVQYSESTYQFISRLLAEEGLSWRIEADDKAPSGHSVVIFADSRQLPEDLLSVSANGGRGIRFHRADSQEDQDSILAFGERRKLQSGMTTVLSYDYKSKKSIATSVPTTLALSGKHRCLESYDDAGPYAFASTAEAERYGRLAMEALEARYQTWLGRGTVRSLTVGTRLDLIGLPINPNQPDADHRYVVTSAFHVGINNLTGDAMRAIAQRMKEPQFIGIDNGLDTPDIHDIVHAPDTIPAELLSIAIERGYANNFEALHADTPWRTRLIDDTGARLNPRPTAPGPMSAIVVGVDGNTVPNGVDEIWCDQIGRIKIRYHWQLGETADDTSSSWVRVISRQAGAGMGFQFLPRIGQEVLIDFFNGDIERPFVMGTLYNGKGEGGIPATPGGAQGETDTSVFDQSTDHRPSGQGNLAGGNSPAWHGGAENSHNHSDALSGFKSKEFGGSGYNQLVFDDTDNQQRIQLKSTQHASELNLGHLVHQADNYRGSFRGTGAELRTDAYGALRAGRGLIMVTWPHASPGSPAGDMSPAMALLKQADTLAQTMSNAAGTHQTVQLAAAIGSTGQNKSTLDDSAAPIKALHKAASGMVDAKDQDAAISDAQQKNTAIGNNKLPHLTDAAIIQAAKDSFGTIAGQNLHYTNGETTSFESGQDSNFAIAGKARIQAGQAIGLLAGAINPGEGNTGIKLIAAKDDIDLQAQSDEMKFQAKKDMKLVSANANIDFAAAKKIHLAVQGGASITIDGGITVQCPGTITIHASKKSFSGPTKGSYPLPTFPQSALPDTPAAFSMLLTHIPGSTGMPLRDLDWQIVRAEDEDGARMADSLLLNGRSNAEGQLELSEAEQVTLKEHYDDSPGNIWVRFGGQVRKLNLTQENENWTEIQRMEYAMDALGFSDMLYSIQGNTPMDTGHEQWARKSAKSMATDAVFKQIKKG